MKNLTSLFTIALALLSQSALADTQYFSTSVINTGLDPNNATWSGTSWNPTSTGNTPTGVWVDGNVAVLPDSPNNKPTGIILGANRSVSGLYFESGTSSNIVYLDGVGGFGVTLNNGSSAVNVSVEAGQAALVFASISGTSGLNKLGFGSFEMRGSTTGLSGSLVVNEGTLFGGSVSDAFNISSGTFHVGGGLLGSGNEVATMNVGGSIEMTSGWISVALDNDTGVWALRENADLLLTGGTLKLTILSLSEFDQITGSGAGSAFSIDGATIELQIGSIVDYTETYQIFDGFALGDNEGVSFTGFDSGYTASVSSSGVLSFAAVPEPSTYALMALGLGAILFVTNNRRKASI